ncbi:hypothetical protein AB0O64_25540 [Streptomyces sp. NPDC088341]|uniref:hypothetical protein n=1 Tax=Streptomyces sp. NPDC088341 TaxID=3154870 RepID=UPI0034140FF9
MAAGNGEAEGVRWFGGRRERDGKGTGGTERSGAPEPGARESGRSGGEETPPLPGAYADDTDGPASTTALQIAARALRAFVQGDEERAVSLCETAVLVGAGTELFAMAEYRLGIGVADHQAVRHLLDAAGVGGMAPAHPFPRAEALNNLRARDTRWTELCRRARSGPTRLGDGVARAATVSGTRPRIPPRSPEPETRTTPLAWGHVGRGRGQELSPSAGPGVGSGPCEAPARPAGGDGGLWGEEPVGW